ncbi:hypothetical protein Ddye_013814 [Dipteronia dyeriana]|uniref:CCHC-type domain-containing protein n=1 Tax=Dipteronia dyeriana TaxID=168575 RepID=A0AAD9X737_9ROSI|nr:hypothetical protein Ddye_013814 [Dipteronia dyeriana]
MCKQWDDVIKLYYHATYTYCIEEFELEMAELKDTHHDHIKQRVLQSQQCEVHPIDCNRFKVDDKWTDTIVDLEQRSCSCRQWDLDELQWLPGMQMTALCSDFYTIGWLKHAYSMIVNPVPKPETWNIPDEIRHRIILPWKKKRLTERPKKSRIPSAGEFRKQKLCSNCGGKGHNKRSCPNPSCSTSKPLKKHVLVAFASKKDIID